MLSAIITSETLTVDDILPDLALALACYGVGDGSGIEEWYEPLLRAGKITHIVVYLNNKAYVLKGRDYTDLAEMPHICVQYKGEWIGDKSVTDEYKYIYDESQPKPKLIQLTALNKTRIFNSGE